MAYSPGAIQRSATVIREVGIYDGANPPVLLAGDAAPVTDATPITSTPGSSIADVTRTVQLESTLVKATEGSTAKATVSGYRVQAKYDNYQRCAIQTGFTAAKTVIAQSTGFARASRLFTADSDDTLISGRSRINSLILPFVPSPPNQYSLGMRIYAGAAIGSLESYIRAQWDPLVGAGGQWAMEYRYHYFDSGQPTIIVGSWALDGFDALDANADEISWEYKLNNGESVTARALANLYSFDGDWWEFVQSPYHHGSLYLTQQAGTGLSEGFASRDAETEVDQTYVARSFPINPREL